MDVSPGRSAATGIQICAATVAALLLLPVSAGAQTPPPDPTTTTAQETTTTTAQETTTSTAPETTTTTTTVPDTSSSTSTSTTSTTTDPSASTSSTSSTTTPGTTGTTAPGQGTTTPDGGTTTTVKGATTTTAVGETTTTAQDGGGDTGGASTGDTYTGAGNTGGGNIHGTNPIAELAPGVWEQPLMIGGTNATPGVSLVSAAADVRSEAERNLDAARIAEVDAAERIAPAELELADANRALLVARTEVAHRKAVADAANTLSDRVSVQSYVSRFTMDDPQMLLVLGDADRSLALKSLGDVVAGAAATALADAGVHMQEALERERVAQQRFDAAAEALLKARTDLGSARSVRSLAQASAFALVLDNAVVNDAGGVPNVALDGSADLPLTNLITMAGPVTFPIAGTWDFIDSWGYPRSGGRSHKGNDIFANYGEPVVALEDGVVKTSSNSLGGQVIYLFGRSGNRYYYAHLSAFAPFIEGAQVVAGQYIGNVGNSGNAISTPPHLHFEVRPPQTRADVNPYPMLRTLSSAIDTARAGGQVPLTPASALVAMKVEDARGRWDQDRVNVDSLRHLPAADIATLVSSTRIAPVALGLLPPELYLATKALLSAELQKLVPSVPGPPLAAPLPPVEMPANMKPGTKSADASGPTTTSVALAQLIETTTTASTTTTATTAKPSSTSGASG